MFSSDTNQLWKVRKSGRKIAFENVHYPGQWLGTDNNKSWAKSTAKTKIFWWTFQGNYSIRNFLKAD